MIGHTCNLQLQYVCHVLSPTPDAEDAQGRCQIEMRCVELGMSHFVVELSVSFFVTNGFVCADLDRKRP